MKRILILSALCALFLVPAPVAEAMTVPADVTVRGNDPIDQILAVLKEVVDM